MLAARLKGRKVLSPALLGRVVAGVGNIYACALAADITAAKRGDRSSGRAASADARVVLARAIDAGGSAPRPRCADRTRIFQHSLRTVGRRTLSGTTVVNRFNA